MSIGGINITETLEKAKLSLARDKGISDSLRSLVELLLVIIGLLLERLGVNSQNSSKPPSQDPNRKRGRGNRVKSSRKPGAQKGHQGNTLTMSDSPDEIVTIDIDRRTIPQGVYEELPRERRQVIDIIISKHITEYQSQTLVNQETGERFSASFPDDIKAPVQYGPSIRSMATYLSLWQLLPYDRIREFFSDQAEIPISPGSVFNSNQDAYERLADFEEIAKQNLTQALVINADETGINVGGKTIWLHSASNELWTLFTPHAKRGSEATDDIGILPLFNGTLVHDCWGSYFKYSCVHAICNAHILRELTATWETDSYKWAKKMEEFLRKTNEAVHAAGGILSKMEIAKTEKKYDKIMRTAEKECPLPDSSSYKKRGRIKKSKARNLLERLIEHKDAILRFIHDPLIPFTNNRAENDIRMTKVQQKISGCFRSMDGAKIFCRVRSYLSTCRKNGLPATTALNMLFQGQLPDFIRKSKK